MKIVRQALRALTSNIPFKGRYRLADKAGALLAGDLHEVIDMNGLKVELDHNVLTHRMMYYGLYEENVVNHLKRTIKPGDVVLLGDKEHNSNLIPWLRLQKKGVIKVDHIESNVEGVFDLEDLVGRSLERLTSRLAGWPLEVALSAPPVEVDPTFLDEAVTNIIENALKYTPAGTPLRITAIGGEVPGRIRLTKTCVIRPAAPAARAHSSPTA
jgi:hypothetical protein